MLSDGEILAALRSGGVEISPFHKEELQPCSYDVRLHLPGYLVRPTSSPPWFSTERPDKVESFETEEKEMRLHPGQLLIAKTKEWISLSEGYAAQIEGRSSLGRMGLNIYQTCGLIDPGFRGRIVLELTATYPIELYDGMSIGQIIFHRLAVPAQKPYQGKYQDQADVRLSKGV